MNKRSSDGSYERLMRQAIATGRAGTHTGRGNTASSDNALSFMKWANLLIDREGDDANPPPTGRSRRMGISGKGREPKPAPVIRTLKHQLRFGEGPEALVLEVHTNPNMAGMAMRKPTRRKTSAGFLMVIDGGKC